MRPWPIALAPPPPALSAAEVHRRLNDPRLWSLFRLDHNDRREAESWVERLNSEDLDVIAQASERVLRLPGSRLGPEANDFFAFLPDSPARPPGLIPLMLLVACAPEVIAFGIAQGFDTDVAASGLGDLGHQVRVHRNATGSFGLFTQWWLTLPWNGSMWWFGRLQYNLIRYEGGYWLSVHIPRGGPLTGVEESFQAARFFAETSLSMFDVQGFHLDSWLLDPYLSQALGEHSNTSRFADLWELQPAPRPADGEALFFTFGHRREVSPAELPRDTRLKRIVAERLERGGRWVSPTGLIPWRT